MTAWELVAHDAAGNLLRHEIVSTAFLAGYLNGIRREESETRVVATVIRKPFGLRFGDIMLPAAFWPAALIDPPIKLR